MGIDIGAADLLSFVTTGVRMMQISVRHKLITRIQATCAACLLFFLGASTIVAQNKLEVEIVTLRDGGFYPSKITRPAGKFLLVVKNRSHAKQVQLGITRSDTTVIASVQQVIDLTQDYSLDLPAATHTLKDSAHPSWIPLTIVTH
jgi:hypothetical protein